MQLTLRDQSSLARSKGIRAEEVPVVHPPIDVWALEDPLLLAESCFVMVSKLPRPL